jgi:hypothetical protein
MSRIINPDSSGKERNRLLKAIVISIRELMKQGSVTAQTRDLAAFVGLALLGVHATIEPTVMPWEKRGYWVKADRFRLDWDWTKFKGIEILAAAFDDDWAAVAVTAVEVGQRLQKIQVSDNHRMGKPWAGAWQAAVGEREKQRKS